MTLQEALTELGIGDGADPDQVRRAYLRLLRTRRPETDPRGFMRLREAYELVKGRIEAREPEPEAPAAPAGEAPEEDDGEDEDSGEDEGEDEDPPSEAAVDALLAEGEHEDAAFELARLFDAAVRALDAQEPPLGEAIQLLLKLHAAGAIKPARALRTSVCAWLDASGQEARLLGGDAAAVWAIARELCSFSASFPGPVRAAIARGALAEDLGSARAELEALRRREPAAAADAAARLRRRAPQLAAQFADVLDPRSARPAARGWWLLWGLLMISLVILRGTVERRSSSGARSGGAGIDSAQPPPPALADGGPPGQDAGAAHDAGPSSPPDAGPRTLPGEP